MAKSKAEIQREYEKRTNYATQQKYNKENTKGSKNFLQNQKLFLTL